MESQLESDPTDSAVCGKCGAVVSADEAARLGDERAYCWVCIRGSGLERFVDDPESLVERVQLSSRQSFVRQVWSAYTMAAGFTAVYTLVFLAMGLVAVAEDVERIAAVPRIAALFFAFCWSMHAVFAMPAAIYADLLWRPRVIQIDRDDLVVRASGATRRYPLDQCQWRVVRYMANDTSGTYLPGFPKVVIKSPATRLAGRCKYEYFACGFTQEMYELWCKYLSFRGVPYWALPLGIQMMGAGLIGCLAGLPIGVLLGCVAAAVWGDALWIAEGAALAAVVGACIEIVRLLRQESRMRKDEDANGR